MAKRVLCLFLVSVFVFWVFFVSSGCMGKKTYNISGRVTVGQTGQGLGGVSITFSGGFSPVTTDNNGYWSKTGLSGTVTVIPVKTGWVFHPPSIVVTGSTGNVNFTATQEESEETETPTVPEAPTDLRVTAFSNTSITLTWQDNSDNETGFRIYRREASGTYPSTPLVTLGANVTTYTDSSVEAGKTYYYRVCAFNDGGSSGYSNEVSALALDPNPPAKPSGLTIEKIIEENDGSLAVYLHWQDASNNEQKFILERKKEADTAFSKLAEIDTSNIAGTGDQVDYIDRIYPEDGTCYYRVKAWNVYGDSGYSDEISTIGSIEIIIQ